MGQDKYKRVKQMIRHFIDKLREKLTDDGRNSKIDTFGALLLAESWIS